MMAGLPISPVKKSYFNEFKR
jgi:hypothetical protein